MVDDHPGDFLLTWVTATGSGSLETLRDGLQWWASARGVQDARAWMWAREMSALGYLDISWSSQRWAAAESCVTMLPEADGLLLVTGARLPALLDVVDALDDVYPDLYDVGVAGGLPLPRALHLLPEPTVTVMSVGRRLTGLGWGTGVTPCSALSLASRLPSLATPRPVVGPPRTGLTVERFNHDSVGAMSRSARTWTALSAVRGLGPGLYRWRDPLLVHRFYDGDEWLRVDRDDGVYRALAREGHLHELAYRPYRDLPESGELLVPTQAPLPPPQRRAVALCSGLPPEVGLTSERYANVPLLVAESVAESLGQQLRRVQPSEVPHVVG